MTHRIQYPDEAPFMTVDTQSLPFDFGDVVLVPFPFTSHIASKKRPAVMASNRTYNTAKPDPDVVVMAVTSQLCASSTLGELPVGQWQTAGLLRPSVVEPVFATLERKRNRRSQPASISAATPRITVSISAIQSPTSSGPGGPGSASSPG
jgi:mRNA interferase MazF